MAVNLQTVLAAVSIAETLAPEAAVVITTLVAEVKELFEASDQTTIDAALGKLDADADAAFAASQQVTDPS